MKKTLNTTFHGIGVAACVYGALLMVKAAGMADLGGEFAELARVAFCGVCALGIGSFVGWWKI